MSTRANKHITKYNQLVEVYDPDGIDKVNRVEGGEATLEARKAGVEVIRERAEELTAADFFSESERADIADNDSMPDPDTVAESQRADIIERLAEIERALNAALAESSALDEESGLGAGGLDDP